MKSIPSRRPPDVTTLLQLLSDASIDFVLHGAVAAMAYGVELDPGDLDITPALGEANLGRLGALLIAIGAVPEDFGHWETKSNGERRWISEDCSAEARLAWQPNARDLTTFDHLFFTTHGNFDVVPEVGGTYAELIERTEQTEWAGLTLQVTHIDDLLARMTIPRRDKDIPRVAALRGLQRHSAMKDDRPRMPQQM